MTCGVPDFDNIVEDFIAESGERLNMAVDDVLCLEQGPDRDAIDRIFRVVHTLKGTAGMFNFKGLSDFLHRFEDSCSEIRSGERAVDKPMADNLLLCLDLVQSKLDFIKAEHREDEDFSLGEAYIRALQGGPAMPTPTASAISAVGPRPVRASSPDTLDEFLSLAGGGPCKTLIAETDFVTRKLLFSFLSRFSTCYVAKDGNEAIQAVTESYVGAEAEPFDLIVMNGALPMIDGLQAARAIRALERAKGADQNRSQARILIATDLGDARARRTALHECGADAFMAKPLDLRELMDLLVRHLVLPRAWRRDSARQALSA